MEEGLAGRAADQVLAPLDPCVAERAALLRLDEVPGPAGVGRLPAPARGPGEGLRPFPEAPPQSADQEERSCEHSEAPGGEVAVMVGVGRSTEPAGRDVETELLEPPGELGPRVVHEEIDRSVDLGGVHDPLVVAPVSRPVPARGW